MNPNYRPTHFNDRDIQHILHRLDAIDNRLLDLNNRISKLEEENEIVPPTRELTKWETAVDKAEHKMDLSAAEKQVISDITLLPVDIEYDLPNLHYERNKPEMEWNNLTLPKNSVYAETADLRNENEMLRQEINTLRTAIMKVNPELKDNTDVMESPMTSNH